MRLGILILVAAIMASAQDYRGEASASVGAGVRGAEDLPSGGYTTWTAGGGYRLSDNWTVRGEFAQHRKGPVNMFGGSLMREWEGDRWRPFAEFGVGAGWHRFSWDNVQFNLIGERAGVVRVRSSNGYLGVTIAGGATLDLFERYFIRPQVRLHMMGPIYIGLQPAIAGGVRF
jgi:hypothetical protein